ncbi:hypothetical protein BDZ89DRAFT_1162805 [Hymenopellis radicata]|nr:hypothetical protein BDZ89DRAFT_1162805 [Hymenopellis radicata]
MADIDMADIEPPITKESDSIEFIPLRLVDQPSPYAHLFGTSIAFSERPEDFALKDELAGFIGVVDGEISACKRKVDGLRAALIAAEQDLADAKAFRDHHVSIFPPIHTLPPELLAKIFKRVVGCDMVQLWQPPLGGPWILKRVCRYWQGIAESEPRLWRCFEVTPTIEGLMSFHMPPHHDMNFPAGALDILENLAILNTGGAELHQLDVLEKFDNVPRLQTLHMDLPPQSVLTDSPSTIANFPWFQLTSLSLRFGMQIQSPAYWCHRILAGCSQLITFYQQDYPFTEGVDLSDIESLRSGPILLCPQIQTLGLYRIGILSRLRCPRLKNLSLPVMESDGSVREVADFLNRSSPQQFNNLTVILQHAYTSNLTIVFLAMPKVTSLTVTAMCAIIRILDVWEELAQNPCAMIPLLQSVEVRFDMSVMQVSAAAAVTLSEHISMRARSSQLAHFSLELYTTATVQHCVCSGERTPIYDASPSSPLGQFLSVFRAATIPGVEIKLIVNVSLQTST